jgi:hypothetical protein
MANLNKERMRAVPDTDELKWWENFANYFKDFYNAFYGKSTSRRITYIEKSKHKITYIKRHT